MPENELKNYVIEKDGGTLYLQGTNLTVTNKRVYAQFPDQFQEIYTQERRLALGIRAKL